MIRPYAVAVLALTAALTLAARPARCGGLDLTWDECAFSPGAVQSIDLDCSGAALPPMVVSFNVDTAIPDLTGIDAVLRLHADDTPEIPPFWQFQFGSCATSGIAPSHRWRTTSTGCTTPWGLFGGTTQSSLNSVRLDDRHAEFYVSVRNGILAPVALDAGVRYFAFELQLYVETPVCAGCTAPISIDLLQIVVSRASGSTWILNGPGGVGICITSHGGDCGGDCGRLECPAVATTWSALKSLYR